MQHILQKYTLHTCHESAQNGPSKCAFTLSIMMKELRKWLKLPSPRLALNTFQIVDQTITKMVGLIKDLKIQIHGIPYIAMFSIMNNNTLDSNYSMLLGQPWLCNACVTHDWGNNLITIEGNGIVQTIVVTKHLDSNTKHLKVLLCYDLMKGVTYKEEEIFFVIKPNLFTIGTTTLLELEILSAIIFNA
jgi:hypothetical protein